MSDKSKSGVRPVILGGILAAAIGIIVFMFLPKAGPLNQPVISTSELITEAGSPDISADGPVAPLPGPNFDTFRVEPDGRMVIAGRAAPDQRVAILLGGQMIETVTADASGSFVAFPLAEPSDQPRRLSLVSDPDGAAVRSETSYIVAPIVAAKTPDQTSNANAPLIAGLPDAPDNPVIADASPPITPTPASPVVLQTADEGVRIVQGTTGQETPNVALDAITYDPDGGVQLAGRAAGDGAVQVYINNEPLSTAPVVEGGDWRIDLPDIDTGVYTLRIDEVDDAGDVVSRLETPFKREEPADIAAVLAEETSADGFEVAVKTVQPGATLWAIAEENLGDGILYVEVFAANSDLIRDPDLIYPGQIFRIPEIVD